MRGADPDEAFSTVPYEKGFALLFYLETLLGGPGKKVAALIVLHLLFEQAE